MHSHTYTHAHPHKHTHVNIPPAELGVVLAEGTLVLQVQFSPALRVQRAEHLDQNILQDRRAWSSNHGNTINSQLCIQYIQCVLYIFTQRAYTK